MRRYLHTSCAGRAHIGAAESFVSFIPLFAGLAAPVRSSSCSDAVEHTRCLLLRAESERRLCHCFSFYLLQLCRSQAACHRLVARWPFGVRLARFVWQGVAHASPLRRWRLKRALASVALASASLMPNKALALATPKGLSATSCSPQPVLGYGYCHNLVTAIDC
jgi:hypothetical protein